MGTLVFLREEAEITEQTEFWRFPPVPFFSSFPRSPGYGISSGRDSKRNRVLAPLASSISRASSVPSIADFGNT